MTASTTGSAPATPLYPLFMLALCVVALAINVAQHAFGADPQIKTLLNYADIVICLGLGIDFFVTLWRAPRRWKYFFTWGWLDLLSSIPALDFARWGRFARIARLARIFRGVRAMKLVASVLSDKRRQSTLLATALLAVVLVIGSSTAILHFETHERSNIRSAEDALWWSFATITTVGYGDHFPVSTAGRVIAALLMTAGVGLFGALSASMAAWFLQPDERATESELALLREEIASLRRAIEESRTPPSPAPGV